ncbi:zinc-ribbon domain containing protein [Aquimarina mytili]|uniref:Zinc-ribbon domain containing protein n=1 Tax=Aquimarina mytili TaxID=874423 RepID=A0A936ZQ08_9FLAO|nr:zinc-ribbon domain containing protein [Aquimarina mytili]MBL0682192.1 zinc-ribbon domain containing protein [Aquimarina mytili]
MGKKPIEDNTGYILNNLDIGWLKKRVGNIDVICPCCLDKKDSRDTPLFDNFLNLLKHGYIHKELKTLESIANELLDYINKQSKANTLKKDQIMYHTRLWACNQCVINKKALFADISKQQSSFEGPCMMYVDINLNCKYCNVPFCFTAREQQYWYEELSLRLESKATRCSECRKKKDVQKRLMKLLAKNTEFSAEELEELIECYTIIGSHKKIKEFKGRLRNIKNNKRKS